MLDKCEFINITKDTEEYLTFKCKNCGKVVTLSTLSQSDLLNLYICTNVPESNIAIEKLGITLADSLHYAGALMNWTKAGFPERTQEEVEKYLEICKKCVNYIDGRCATCRCRVNSGPAIVNKIRMATENCPKDLWK